MSDIKLSKDQIEALNYAILSDAEKEIAYAESQKPETERTNRLNFRIQFATLIVGILTLIATVAGLLLSLLSR